MVSYIGIEIGNDIVDIASVSLVKIRPLARLFLFAVVFVLARHRHFVLYAALIIFATYVPLARSINSAKK